MQENIVLSSEPTDICCGNSPGFDFCRSKTWRGKYDFTLELKDASALPGSLISNESVIAYFNCLEAARNSDETKQWFSTHTLRDRFGNIAGQVTIRPLGGCRFSVRQLVELRTIFVDIQRQYAGEESVVYCASELANQTLTMEVFQHLWKILPDEVSQSFDDLTPGAMNLDIVNGHSQVAYLLRMAILESNLNCRQENKYGYHGLYQVNFSAIRKIFDVQGDINFSINKRSVFDVETSLNIFLDNPRLQMQCVQGLWTYQFNMQLRPALEASHIDIDRVISQGCIEFYLPEQKKVLKPMGTILVDPDTYRVPSTLSSMVAFCHVAGPNALLDFLRGRWNDDMVDPQGTRAWEFAERMSVAPDGQPYDVRRLIGLRRKGSVSSFWPDGYWLYREGTETLRSCLFHCSAYLPVQLIWAHNSKRNIITMGPKFGCSDITFHQPNAELKLRLRYWVKVLSNNTNEVATFRIERHGFLLCLDGTFSAASVRKVEKEFEMLVDAAVDNEYIPHATFVEPDVRRGCGWLSSRRLAGVPHSPSETT